MKTEQTSIYKPVKGKTYSLFGNTRSTDQYYETISQLVDVCLKQYTDVEELLTQIQKASRKKKIPQKLYGTRDNYSLGSFFKDHVNPRLSMYTKGVAHHLSSLSLSQKWDRTLRTTENQYHLYMLEIELVNRIHKEKFKACEFKIALLPYCIRELQQKCHAVKGDIEHICKGCTEICFINRATELLKKYQIRPYILMTMNYEAKLKKLKTEYKSFGVLGIACIPELVKGLRICMKINIPVVGIPLNANRCARWMGDFYENSFSVEKLENLVG
jgi:hypothetical protein